MKTKVQGRIIDHRGEVSTFEFDMNDYQVNSSAGSDPESPAKLVSEMHSAALESDLFKAEIEGTKSKPSEIAVKTRTLAEFLLNLATGQHWDDAEPELQGNYWLDARETIMSNPHLLSFLERERLSSRYPDLEV